MLARSGSPAADLPQRVVLARSGRPDLRWHIPVAYLLGSLLRLSYASAVMTQLPPKAVIRCAPPWPIIPMVALGTTSDPVGVTSNGPPRAAMAAEPDSASGQE